MEHVRLLADRALHNPVMLFAFTGWNDAGDAASSAVRGMIESWGASALAEIDPDVFTDFATVRPQVRLDEGHHRSIVWPTVGVWSVSLPGTDVLLVLGPEPSLRWRLFCRQLVGVAERYSSPLTISLGALLADVPHTRPVQIFGTASDPEVVDRFAAALPADVVAHTSQVVQRLTPGQVVSTAALAAMVFGPVARLADLAYVFEQTAASVYRLGEILDRELDVVADGHRVAARRFANLEQHDRLAVDAGVGDDLRRGVAYRRDVDYPDSTGRIDLNLLDGPYGLGRVTPGQEDT